MRIKRERMYCSPEFKKLIKIRSVEYGENDITKFTSKIANNPRILLREEHNEKKKQPFRSLF